MNHGPTHMLALILGVALAASVSAQMARAPIYKPPFPGAPKVRVDGRVRGADDALLTLTVLAPEHVGLTTKEHPSLFWYQSKSAKTKFELVITDPKSATPLLEVRLQNVPSDGIQRVRLSDYHISLQLDHEYRWSVAIVLDEENRSKDILASGVIKRVAPAKSLQNRLAGATEANHPFIYADEGIWYDSLEALSDIIDKQPDDKAMHEARAMYFMQVGLNEAAMHEMKLAGKTVAIPSK